MKGQQPKPKDNLCFKCKKKEKLKGMSYCKECKKQYDKERYLKLKDKLKNDKQTVETKKIVDVEQTNKKTENEKPLVNDETLEIQDVGSIKISIIEPPKEKPLFYDVNKNVSEIIRILENNQSFTFLFKGEAGTGKTTFIKYLQWKFQKPIVRINVTVNTEAQELKGKYIIKRDGNGQLITEWVDGLVTTALKNNCWLQIEEVNFMAREHQSIFYSLLDERKEIILEDKNGERISNQNLVVFLTMNPLSFLKPLLPALKSRIDAEYTFSHPDLEEQKNILIQKHNVPENLAHQISETITLIRKQYEKLQISSREAEAWVKILKIKNNGYITKKKDVLSAFKHAVAFKLTDDEAIREGLISVAEAVLEGKVGYEKMLETQNINGDTVDK